MSWVFHIWWLVSNFLHMSRQISDYFGVILKCFKFHRIFVLECRIRVLICSLEFHFCLTLNWSWYLIVNRVLLLRHPEFLLSSSKFSCSIVIQGSFLLQTACQSPAWNVWVLSPLVLTSKWLFLSSPESRIFWKYLLCISCQSLSKGFRFKNFVLRIAMVTDRPIGVLNLSISLMGKSFSDTWLIFQRTSSLVR
jgi:hypothetical protein